MDELAAKASVSNSTIRDFEAGRREPHKNRLATIRQALETAGMVFTGKDGDESWGIAGRPHGKPRAVAVGEGARGGRQRKPEPRSKGRP
jgi:hypothetical protein